MTPAHGTICAFTDRAYSCIRSQSMPEPAVTLSWQLQSRDVMAPRHQGMTIFEEYGGCPFHPQLILSYLHEDVSREQ